MTFTFTLCRSIPTATITVLTLNSSRSTCEVNFVGCFVCNPENTHLLTNYIKTIDSIQYCEGESEDGNRTIVDIKLQMIKGDYLESVKGIISQIREQQENLASHLPEITTCVGNNSERIPTGFFVVSISISGKSYSEYLQTLKAKCIAVEEAAELMIDMVFSDTRLHFFQLAHHNWPVPTKKLNFLISKFGILMFHQ